MALARRITLVTAGLALAGMLLAGATARSAGSPPILGVNVDMSTLIPRSPNYVRTSRGDLFDIAHAAGFNTFRIVDWTPWSPSAGRPSYTPDDWRYLIKRANATNISLIPVLAQTMHSPADKFVSDATNKAEMILDDAQLQSSGRLAFVDIVNEPKLSADHVRAIARVSEYVHAKHPGVKVTVGGWGPLLVSGAPLAPSVDVWSPHIYGISINGRTVSYNDSAPFEISQRVAAQLGWLNEFAGGKPIVIEEFGIPSGLLNWGNRKLSSPAGPDVQARHVDAMVDAIHRARMRGIPVIGALEWIFYPAGGGKQMMAPWNAGAMIVPHGTGRPLQILPAVEALCRGFGAACPGARDLIEHPPVLESGG